MPFQAGRETSAWSRGDVTPAVTRMAPSSLRSRRDMGFVVDVAITKRPAATVPIRD
jgi:hypothetical protein